MGVSINQLRQTITTLRDDAATCLRSSELETRARGRGFLRMVEILKVQLAARGDRSVVVTSKEGRTYRAV